MQEEHSASAALAQAVEELRRVLARTRRQDVDAAVLGAVDASLVEARSTVRELTRSAGTGTRSGKVSVRGQVVEALTDLGVPARPALIAAYHRAVYGSGLQPRGLATLRRDEARTLENSGAARVLVVPALTPLLTPARGLFALSTWPGQRRIIGPYSERVNRLHAVHRMLDYLQGLPDADEQHRAAITGVLVNFGQSIDGIGLTGIEFTVARAFLDDQLALVESKDLVDRKWAAGRLDEETDLTVRLFGNKKP